MHCCHCLWIKKNAATPLSPWKVGEFFPIFNSQKKKNNKKKFLFKKSQFDKPPQNKQLYHFRSARSARTHKCREVLDRKKKLKDKEFIIHEEQLWKERKVCVCVDDNETYRNTIHAKKCTKEREKKNKNWTKGIFCSNWIPWMENTTKHREREREKGYTRNQRKIFQTIVFLSPPFFGLFLYIYIYYI